MSILPGLGFPTVSPRCARAFVRYGWVLWKGVSGKSVERIGRQHRPVEVDPGLDTGIGTHRGRGTVPAHGMSHDGHATRVDQRVVAELGEQRTDRHLG